MISIWFFIGVSLLINGLLIMSAGIYEWVRPPEHPTVALFQLHANAWWGALLTVVGLIYCYFFSPKKTKA